MVRLETILGSMLAAAPLAVALLSACATQDENVDRASSALTCDNAVAVCCKALFPPGRNRGQCVAEGHHGTGPCACNADAGVADASDASDASDATDAALDAPALDASDAAEDADAADADALP